MIPSVMTILQDKKKQQLASVLLVQHHGQIVVCPFLALPEERKKRFQLFRLDTWGILDIPNPLDPEDVRYHVDNWIGIAKENSTLVILASSVPIQVPGVKVEKFGDGWPRDWEAQGRAIFKDKRCELEGTTLARLLRLDSNNDLVKAFHAALWLAFRFNFFATTPEEAEAAILRGAGARSIGGDLRGGLKIWKQPFISGPPAPLSPLARPQTKKGVFET